MVANQLSIINTNISVSRYSQECKSKTAVVVYSFLIFISSFLIGPDMSGFAQDFEVAPVKLVYTCEPGQIQTKTMSVRNHANQKQQFTLTIADAKVDSGQKKNEKSCKDWLTINPSFFDINPNESAEIKVLMQAPPGHSETRWAMIYVSAAEEQTSLATDKQMKTGIKVKPRIGVRVIQSPKSNTNYQATISGLKEITQQKDTVRAFQVNIKNTGDKVLDGKIYLVLSNLETAKEIKVKPVKASVYPGNSKTMKMNLPQNVPPGKYSLAAILDYGNNSTLEAVQMNIEVK
ncbi:MAG: hypothetical protein AABZ32_11355 [Bacteroidota bacterium]